MNQSVSLSSKTMPPSLSEAGVEELSVRPTSYGCMWEVAKHKRSVKVAQGNSRVQLLLLECLILLPKYIPNSIDAC